MSIFPLSNGIIQISRSQSQNPKKWAVFFYPWVKFCPSPGGKSPKKPIADTTTEN